MTTTLATTAVSTSLYVRLEFADYVARQRPALLRAARAIAGDAHSAEDLLQCALVRVLPHWSAIREPSAADAYIRRAMRNQHASWYRQKWRSQEHAFADVPDLKPSWDRHPGTDTALWPLVAALPPAQRSAVALRYYEGLSVARGLPSPRLLTGHRQVEHQPRPLIATPFDRRQRLSARPRRLRQHRPSPTYPDGLCCPSRTEGSR